MLPSSIAILPCNSRAPRGPVTSTSKVDRPLTLAGIKRFSSAIDAVPSSCSRPDAPSSTPTLPDATIVDCGPVHSKASTCSSPFSSRSAVVRCVFSFMLPTVRAPPCSCTRACTESRRGADAVPSTVRFRVPVRSAGGSLHQLRQHRGHGHRRSQRERGRFSGAIAAWRGGPRAATASGWWPGRRPRCRAPCRQSRSRGSFRVSASATTFTPFASSCSPRTRVASSRVACPVGWNVSSRAPRNTSAFTVPSAVMSSGTRPGASAVRSATGPFRVTASSAPVTAAGDRRDLERALADRQPCRFDDVDDAGIEPRAAGPRQSHRTPTYLTVEARQRQIDIEVREVLNASRQVHGGVGRHGQILDVLVGEAGQPRQLRDVGARESDAAFEWPRRVEGQAPVDADAIVRRTRRHVRDAARRLPRAPSGR